MDMSRIVLDGRAQSRLILSDETITEYQQEMEGKATFPPVVVFGTSERAWLADGWHRYRAAERAGLTEIDADVRSGGLREAILYSVGANASHGLRRTNADKRRAVEVLLRDPEWAKWSDHKIADQCGVGQPFVSRMRQQLSDSGNQIAAPVRIAERNGTQYEIRPAQRLVGGRPSTQPDHRGEDRQDTARPIQAPLTDLGLPSGPEGESDEERALYGLSRQRLSLKLSPEDVAAAATDPVGMLESFERFEQWFAQFMIALRERASGKIRRVK